MYLSQRLHASTGTESSSAGIRGMSPSLTMSLAGSAIVQWPHGGTPTVGLSPSFFFLSFFLLFFLALLSSSSLIPKKQLPVVILISGTDGTGGDQPWYTYVERNYVREIGSIEKQSSFWFQAKTALTSIDSNVVFNGPRAGINFNDGFGGGTNVTNNLIFNQCRESGDHGAMNAWYVRHEHACCSSRRR